MGALSGDCFAHGGGLLTLPEAAALAVRAVHPLDGQERVPLQAARGRVLAEALQASHSLPPFTNSAVDGYAFRHADLPGEGAARLLLGGRVMAGQAGAGRLGPREAFRVLTGAPLPEGADTVLMQEDARIEAGSLLMPPGLALAIQPGANRRLAGEDVVSGALALQQGLRLNPAHLGLAAALGQGSLPVRRRPRIGVFSTGEELVPPNGMPGPAQRFDSNRPMLLALLAGLPVEPSDLGILPDDAAAMAAALSDAAATQDLLLTSGGVSGSEADHVRDAIARSGTVSHWRLAVKPGRPVAMGVAHGIPVVGLPGNPVAAMVAFLHLARPVILRLCGARPEELLRIPARSGFAHDKRPGRREFLRVALAPQPDGIPLATAFPRQGSASLASLVASDAFAELPEDLAAVAPGDVISVLPFAGLF
ncbi:gephyrin-like molybdotransferase Glp [Pseudoroseomonas globiformis]|uniref:Molybdopterin molybdenumtransferase n=1 Tax=Teichococcus globiformis TaxID=2307229 RepID=A0ABV7FT32_9PROT